MACASSAPDEELDSAVHVADYLPSWLASLAVHLTLILLLALLQVFGKGGFGESSILLDCTADGPQGTEDDSLLAASIELPSELTADEPAETPIPEVAELATPVDSVSKIELMNPAGGQKPLPGTDVKGAGAAPVQTAIFGLRGEGTDFVYVFDRSDSMNSTFSFASEGETIFSITPLEAAKAELVRSLKDLNPGNRFHIVFYNHGTWLFDPGSTPARGLIQASPENKRRAVDFIASVDAHGQTRHVPPLEIALRMKPDVIFLLTDGEEKDDPSAADVGRLRRLNGGRTKINVIQFCYEPRTGGSLAQLANESGGRHVFMNIRQLAPSLAELAEKAAAAKDKTQ